jgi:polysaccharide biosynthesis PFTS motif protein
LDRFGRRVGVLDTSTSSALSPADIASFYAGVLRLAAREPEVVFLLKPKNPPETVLGGEAGERVLRAIDTAPNVVLLPNRFETAAIVGLTDATISACFTSTVVEGIGCGRPAVYYDPTDRFPDVFWRRIPDMVCVTDEELFERIHYLLWECDPETYLAYLRRHCSALEGFFDGLAITRLRRHLARAALGRER